MRNEQKRQTELERLAVARRIRAAGVPIFIPTDDTPDPNPASDLLIRQTGGVVESNLSDFCDRTQVILWVSIIVNLPRFAIARFELELPWPCRISWIPDAADSVSHPKVYRFGDLEFARHQVLNHHADVRRLLSRGESLDGVLLGIGDEPIPEGFRHGANVPGFLVVYDQFGHEYKSSVSFWVDRSDRINARRKPRISQQKKGLFACRDPRPR